MSSLAANQLRALDGDRSYHEYTGDVRIRDGGFGNLLVQILVPNGELFDMSTFVVQGSKRDTISGLSGWPTYAAQDSFHDLQTTTSRDTAEAVSSQGSVTVDPNAAPVSASTNKANR
jgi:hypothetical protein